MRDLEAEKTELQAMLDGLKKSLEAETLSRVDIQNHIQSLKEELAFRKKVHEEVCSLWLETMLLQGHAIIITLTVGRLTYDINFVISEWSGSLLYCV